MLLFWSISALSLALIFLWQSARGQRAAGIPSGRIIYTDTKTWRRVEKALFDPIAGLTGKPDYLVKNGKTVLPVEVKSGRTPQAPYDAHIFQLAAYCLLVERKYGVRPPYGIIHYPKHIFAVDYTPDLESALFDVLSEMRNLERNKDVERSHEEVARCNGCGFRQQCDQRL